MLVPQINVCQPFLTLEMRKGRWCVCTSERTHTCTHTPTPASIALTGSVLWSTRFPHSNCQFTSLYRGITQIGVYRRAEASSNGNSNMGLTHKHPYKKQLKLYCLAPVIWPRSKLQRLHNRVGIRWLASTPYTKETLAAYVYWENQTPWWEGNKTLRRERHRYDSSQEPDPVPDWTMIL